MFLRKKIVVKLKLAGKLQATKKRECLKELL